MRVLHATYWHFPSTGAIDIYLDMLLEHLPNHGLQPSVLSRGSKWTELCLRADTSKQIDLLKAWPLVAPGMHAQFTGLEPAPRWILEREQEQYLFEMGSLGLCDFSKVEMVHAHDVHSARAFGRIAPRHVPVVLTTHGLLAYEWLVENRIPGGDSAEWRYTFLREKAGIESSTITITPSEWMLQEYVGYFGLSECKFRVLPYAKPLAEFYDDYKKEPEDVPDLSGRKVVACVARLVPLKGHRYLLEAVHRIKEHLPEILCLLIGDGPLEPALRQMVKELGLSGHVSFLGRRTDVPALLRRSHLFVLPSLHEITPIAVTEAQLAAKPVVATKVGGIPELIQSGKTGLLVPPADSGALQREILRLLKDPGLARRLGDNAQDKTLQERDLETHLSQIISVYKEAVDTHLQL